MMLALSFLVPDAIVSTRTEVPYIETVERITDSAYAIAGQPVKVKQPRVGGTRTGCVSFGWFRQNIADNVRDRLSKTGVRNRMEKAHSQVQAEQTA